MIGIIYAVNLKNYLVVSVELIHIHTNSLYQQTTSKGWAGNCSAFCGYEFPKFLVKRLSLKS